MWTLIQTLLKGALLKWLLKTLGSLGILVPVAFILKMVGLPVLMVLTILGGVTMVQRLYSGWRRLRPESSG